MTAIEPSAPPHVIPAEDRAVLAITGGEAQHFLHNLVTADIAGLAPGTGSAAALLTPQGKIIADMLVFNGSDDEPLYLIDVAAGLADDLLERLERYRLRAAIAISRLGAPIDMRICLDAPPVEGPDFYAFADPRAPELGQRLYGPRDALERATAGFAPGAAEAYHARRVALGIPEAGKDFVTGDAFPHEVNLDQLGGVDFRKGCYIGQEVVSRMEHRGTARTRALAARFLNGFGVTGGAEVMAGERAIGRVGESFGDRAIAILRLDRLAEAEAAGLPVTAGGVPVELTPPAYARFGKGMA
ncbi:MAG: YgfZ/GcvT domain-containing protein [Rhabdaerophilum calidifontis]